MVLHRCSPTETALDRDRAIDRPAVATLPNTGISRPIGDECCASGDGDSSLTWGFPGPAVLTDRRSCCGHDGGVVLIRLRGCEAPVQEDPPLVIHAGVFLVCTCCCPLVYTTPASPVHVLTLKGGAWVIGVIPLRLQLSVGPRHI
jgi:hypothetical protein